MTEKSREKAEIELETQLLDAERLRMEAEDKLSAAEEAREEGEADDEVEE